MRKNLLFIHDTKQDARAKKVQIMVQTFNKIYFQNMIINILGCKLENLRKKQNFYRKRFLNFSFFLFFFFGCSLKISDLKKIEIKDWEK